MPRAEPCLSTSFQSRDELPEVPDMVARMLEREGRRVGRVADLGGEANAWRWKMCGECCAGLWCAELWCDGEEGRDGSGSMAGLYAGESRTLALGLAAS